MGILAISGWPRGHRLPIAHPGHCSRIRKRREYWKCCAVEPGVGGLSIRVSTLPNSPPVLPKLHDATYQGSG